MCGSTVTEWLFVSAELSQCSLSALSLNAVCCLGFTHCFNQGSCGADAAVCYSSCRGFRLISLTLFLSRLLWLSSLLSVTTPSWIFLFGKYKVATSPQLASLYLADTPRLSWLSYILILFFANGKYKMKKGELWSRQQWQQMMRESLFVWLHQFATMCNQLLLYFISVLKFTQNLMDGFKLLDRKTNYSDNRIIILSHF